MNARIAIFTYDSTGLLQQLSVNEPCVGFWRHGLEHLTPAALPYYKMLVDVGVLHFEPTSAAKFIDRVWGDVEDWWLNENLQRARAEFCDVWSRDRESKLSFRSVISSYLINRDNPNHRTMD